MRASEGATIDRNTRLYASYRARQQGRAIAGRNDMWLKAVAPVQVRFRPTFDVAGYREFARDTHTDWVIESLPTRLPLTIGRSNPVTIDVINRGSEAVAGEVQLRLDPSQKGIRVRGDLSFNVAAQSSASVQFELEVTSEVLPQGRQSDRFPVELEIASATHRSVDAAHVYVLPMLQIPETASSTRCGWRSVGYERLCWRSNHPQRSLVETGAQG